VRIRWEARSEHCWEARIEVSRNLFDRTVIRCERRGPQFWRMTTMRPLPRTAVTAQMQQHQAWLRRFFGFAKRPA
jgi:hypothetical protein